jgi:hypothetical protein
MPAPAYPTTTTKNERLSHDGSNLGARTKVADDDDAMTQIYSARIMQFLFVIYYRRELF